MVDLEKEFWRSTRHILHFAGICGAGKTTLTKRIIDRCREHGGIAAGTLDWDPHVGDQHKVAERAFRRDLDLAMIDNPADTRIHRQIVDHSLQMIEQWKVSDANLIVVDRFVESYDHLPATAVREVQAALAASGRAVSQVLLVIGLEVDRHDRIADRLLQTKGHRPAQWWETTPGDVDLFAADEVKCQAAYRRYCAASQFPTAVVDTTAMEWEQYEQSLVDQMMLNSPIADCRWNESMKLHAVNAHSWYSPSSKLGMARPGYKWFATMPGSARP